MNPVTFFAPKGKSMRIGGLKFRNHSYTTTNAAEANKIRECEEYGKTIFELPPNVSPTEFIRANPTRVGTMTTRPDTDGDQHQSMLEFVSTRLAEIMDTEARMSAAKQNPLLSHTSLANYNKDTLIALCKQFNVDYDESETRKALINKLKAVGGPTEE